jgi:hypothetical protein
MKLQVSEVSGEKMLQEESEIHLGQSSAADLEKLAVMLQGTMVRADLEGLRQVRFRLELLEHSKAPSGDAAAVIDASACVSLTQGRLWISKVRGVRAHRAMADHRHRKTCMEEKSFEPGAQLVVLA